MQRIKQLKVTPFYLLFLLVMALVPGYFLFSGGSPAALLESLQNRMLVSYLESAVQRQLPMASQLRQFGLHLRLATGQKEQNGIFISENRLMRNLDPPTEPFANQNTTAIASFARELAIASNGKKNVCVALIPTASGVMQQDLPRFASENAVNQQRLIEELYNNLPESVMTVDVTSVLQNRQDQYLYYRTENNLTALGGFYTYSAIARRLQISNRSLNQFNIEYANNHFYGDLYKTTADSQGVPYQKVKPDTLSLFRFQGDREYVVTQTDASGVRTYHTLYPKHRMDLDNPLDVYLGGLAAVTDIRSSLPKKTTLLVFGDKTALAYLPFFSNYYQQVTLVNLYQISSADLAQIKPNAYDQVLFAYGIESYIHTKNPSFVDKIQWDNPQ